MLGEGSSVSPTENQKVSGCKWGGGAREQGGPGGEGSVRGETRVWLLGLPGDEETLNSLADAQKTADVKRQ